MAMLRMTMILVTMSNPLRADGFAAMDALVRPGFATLAQSSAVLAETARADCTPQSPALRQAYGATFDDWVAVSHFRFGPTEHEDRRFALAYWPDSRGATPARRQHCWGCTKWAPARS